MMKTKKKSTDTEVKSISSNGKVKKAKNIEVISKSLRKVKQSSEPNECVDKKKSEWEMTPFHMKCMSKSTSTPMSVVGNNNIGTGQTTGVGRLNYEVASAPRDILSPILVDIGNKRDDVGRNTSLPTKRSDTRLSKVDEDDKPGKGMKSRRTFGIRRLFPEVDDKTEKNHAKEHFSENLRVRLCRTPSKVINHLTGDMSERIYSRDATQAENTLVKNLRNDWSNSMMEETFKTPQFDAVEKQNRFRTKRLLTPLVEAIVEESIISREDTNTKKIREDENYSSSAEFESDDEKKNCRLKKAPTWKNLHHEPNNSLNLNTSEIRKSRRLTKLMESNKENQAGEIAMPNNVSITSSKFGDSQLPRLMHEISERAVNRSEVSSNRVEAIESKKVTADCPKDLHIKHNLSAGIRLPRVRLRRSKHCSQLLSLDSAKKQCGDQDQDGLSVANKNNHPNCTQLSQELDENPFESQESKMNERDDENIQKTVQRETSPSTLAHSNCIGPQIVDKNSHNRAASHNKISFNTAEGIESEKVTVKCGNDKHTKTNLPAGVRLPRLRLRRSKHCSQLLRLESEKNQHAVHHQDDRDVASKNYTQALRENEAINVNPLESQEPKRNERVDGNIQKTLKEISPSQHKADVVEPTPNSPIYDGVEDATSTTSQHSKKFFHSRIDTTIAVPKTVHATRPSRKRKKNEDSVYDFLSQSSQEEPDPMADIIQKMISTGKVTVAKHKKCTGAVAPRKVYKKAKVAKVKKDLVAKSRPPVETRKPQLKQQNKPIVLQNDGDQHFDDGGMNHFDEDVEPRREDRSFSALARSTMIKEAERNNNTAQRKTITDRRKLLSLAQKIVGQSTPVKLSTETTKIPRCSPIPGNKSPWRVDDDRLPNTFYFGRNSSCLPSYSSDYIPITQTEKKTNSVSSSSSNDSNMENIAPPSERGNSQIEALSIRRSGLNNRSPLKAINILDVVHLPPLVFENTEKDISKENNPTILDRTLNKSKSQTNKTVQIETCANKIDLFGFDEIIDDEDDLTKASLSISAIPTKVDLKEKLQRLRRMRPEVAHASTYKPEPIKCVFDNPKMRQKSLRHMLCSTMIEKPRLGVQEIPKEQHDGFFNDGCDADLSNLFKDPEPETTFNESESRRTYSRLYKKKRRKVRNNFVMFLDSDASEEEEENIHEKRTKKRHKNELKQNDNELKKFANEFNEMCKEVSQYDLIVE